MKKKEIIMLSSLTFLAGIIIGFMLSPIKKGVIVTVHNNIQRGDKTI